MRLRMRVKLIRYAFWIFTLSINNAFSSTIISEDTVGDFHGGQLFTLNSGQNTFTGSQFWGGDKVDGFRFIVQSGYTASISFNFSISGLSDIGALSWVWELNRLSIEDECTPTGGIPHSCLPPRGSELLASEIFQDPVGFVNPSDWGFEPIQGYLLSEGTYQIHDNYGFAQDEGGLFSYAIDIHVTEVPIPASLILYGTLLSILPFLNACLKIRPT